MRVSLLCLLLTTAAGLATAADEGTFSGKWDLQQNIAGNESTQICTFAQKGNELSGTCGSEQRTLTVTGKVEDKKATWSFTTEYNGSPLTLRYTGTLDPQNKITGAVLVEEFSVEGEFTATKTQ